MAKQDAAKVFPQQLSLDLNSAKLAAPQPIKVSPIIKFVDSATLSVRRQALERVKSAGIFAPPNSQKR